jgi:hypothetical protein
MGVVPALKGRSVHKETPLRGLGRLGSSLLQRYPDFDAWLLLPTYLFLAIIGHRRRRLCRSQMG